MSRGVKQAISVAVCFAILIMGMNAPLVGGMSEASRACLVDMAILIVLWGTEVIPKPVSSLLAVCLLFWLGAVDSFATAVSLFINDVFFFLLAAFAIAAAVGASPLPHRILGWFIRISRGSTGFFLLGFMVTTALISSVVSDLAACALFASIASPILKRLNGESEGVKSFRKCLMMGIPMAALAGGITTPIGSTSNMTLLSLLDETTGIQISFLGWMVLGIPMAICAIALSWGALMLFYKPEMPEGIAEAFHLDITKKVPLQAQEIKLVVFMFSIFTAWVVQGLTGFLSSTQIALIGMIVLFLPGIKLLDWNHYAKTVPWDLVIMIGGVIAVGRALGTSGTLDWIVGLLLEGASSWSPIALLAVISVFIIIERAFVPMAPPITIALSPVFMALATAVGLPPICICLAISTWCQITFLIPTFDACWLITYTDRYYSVKDVLRFGWLLTAALLGISLILFPGLSPVAAMLP